MTDRINRNPEAIARMMSGELLRLVERLDEHAEIHDSLAQYDLEQARWGEDLRIAAAAIRGLLEQKPVAWLDPNASDHDDAVVLEAVHKNAREHGAITWWKRYTVPLCALPVAAPAQAEQKTLVEREIDKMWGDAGHGTRRVDIERAVAYGIKVGRQT